MRGLRRRPERDEVVHCPECGAPTRAGERRCSFCGRKLVADVPAAAPPAGGGLRAAAGLLAAAAVVALVGVGLRHAQERLADRPESRASTAAPAPAALRAAAAACEAFARGEVRTPLRVIAFRSSRVSREGEGFVVAGTVDLQSLAGQLVRKRYWCRVRRDEAGAPAVESGRVY